MTNKEDFEREVLLNLLRPALKDLGCSHESHWIVDSLASKKLSLDEKKVLALDILKRRALSEPLAYILGSWAFRSYEFFVGPGVLIPRPETEELVEAALKSVENSGQSAEKFFNEGFRVADLGAGSGCIGLSFIADILKDAHAEGYSPLKLSNKTHLFLVETSKEALSWLKKNVEAMRPHIFETQVHILEKDWKNSDLNEIDILFSNPPYLKKEEFHDTHKSVQDYEPFVALVPQSLSSYSDASGPYREIIEVAQKSLVEGGWLWFELGSQSEWIQNYVSTQGGFNDLRILKDMAGKARFFAARKSNG